jgi:hypothetical protein
MQILNISKTKDSTTNTQPTIKGHQKDTKSRALSGSVHKKNNFKNSNFKGNLTEDTSA